MNPIEMMVEHLFRNCADTEEVRAAKEEITNNCLEHYRDLVKDGMDEGEALEAITDSLCGMEELVKSYPQKQDHPDFQSAGDAKATWESPYHEAPRADGRYDFALYEVNALSLGLLNHDVTLCPSRDGRIHIRFDKQETMEKVSVTCDRGTLNVTTTWKKDMGASFRGFTDATRQVHDMDDMPAFLRKMGRFMEGAFKKTMDTMDDSGITVELPASSMLSCSVGTTGGDIEVEDISFNDLQLKSISGDIHASHITVQHDAKVTSTSGDIEAEITAGSGIACNSVSGDVTLCGACRDKITVRTTSGDADVKPVCAACEAHSVSGDVNVMVTEPVLRSMTLHTVSGDVDLMLPDSLSADIHTSSKSGTVRGGHTTFGFGTVARVDISTVSGNIRLS